MYNKLPQIINTIPSSVTFLMVLSFEVDGFKFLWFVGKLSLPMLRFLRASVSRLKMVIKLYYELSNK